MSKKDVDVVVLDAIASEDDGVSFNNLVRKLEGRVSRATIVKVLRRLLRLGAIVEYKDVKHRQKKIYKVGEKIGLIYRELTLSIHEHPDILSYVKELISRYQRIMSRNLDEISRRYAHHRALNSFGAILEVGIDGEDTFNIG